ncbi:MAG: NADH-dependent [FeFe] hydrogenase, group A6 [Endomicrobiaceae bacterium]|nr:NADH-dependent [FeFe] hydrogenase, group A6 [Endomicrobiaceae bacterium]
MGTVKIFINNHEYSFDSGLTIMQACDLLGIKIPRLCYHPKLSISSGCRICIVEVEGMKNFVASCSYPISEGMKIHTNTEAIRHARKVILELILDNHPKDCNTCVRDEVCELQLLASSIGLRERKFEGDVREPFVDNSSPSIVNNHDKCILCGRCVKVCDQVQNISAIDYANRGFKTVIVPAYNNKISESVCTLCGQCVNICPTAALTEQNYTKDVFALLDDKTKIKVAQIAPSVRVAIGEAFGLKPGSNMAKEIVHALKLLGFDYVFDAQFSADLTIMEEASEFIERLKGHGKLPMITSCSSGWMKALEQFYPDFIDNVSTCKSPMSMMSSIVKSYFADKIGKKPTEIANVAIMCCVAKKYEAKRPELAMEDGNPATDYVLTTRELAWMIKSAGIDFKNLKGMEFDTPLGLSTGAATIFGVSGGVMEAAVRTAYEFATNKTLEDVNIKAVRGNEGIKEGSININGTEIKVAVANGLGNASKLFEEVRKDPSKYHFIEVMACPGGCIGGGGQPYSGIQDLPFDPKLVNARAQALYNADEKNSIRRSHDNPAIKELYKEFLGKPLSEKSHKYLHTHYKQKFPKGILRKSKETK